MHETLRESSASKPTANRLVKHPQRFKSRVFPIQQLLPKRSWEQYNQILAGKSKLDSPLADEIASALKEWALAAGASHFTHWFQPLTGTGAEKHDAFLSWSKEGHAVERFKGNDLMRGEPDASSFPSGGLRATHHARGYTAWDVTSVPFLWEGGDGLTLCIPSLFFSWNGEALDYKIPLLRSEEKINKEGLRLLKLCRVKGEKVFSTLGPEQEYFAMERKWIAKRPDLLLAGRTVFGAKPPKGQELEDHYFGVVKDQILSFMRDVEEGAMSLGIPVKTRHNEVAPNQFEVAPLFEKSNDAVDHNLLLMQLLRQRAARHGLVCLMHEKPFAGINGSGKHNNWSLATDTGLNLLDPKEESMVFLILLTAVLRAVHEHAGLLRASIASAGNDHRLGGAEAPPTILSVYLGEHLEKMVRRIVDGKEGEEEMLRFIDLGLEHLSPYEADPSDRNRTSFFAFTGNKFEFRAVGASAHCSLPVTTINAVVADSLHLILDEIGDAMGDSKDLKLALKVIRKHLKGASAVIFGGDAYSEKWEAEAKKRGLPNIRDSFHAFAQFLDKNSRRAFQGIFTEKELHSRYEILIEQYVKMVMIELRLMIELFRTQILPAALEDQKKRGKALQAIGGKNGAQSKALKEFSAAIQKAMEAIDTLEKMEPQIHDLGWEAKGKVVCDLIAPKMKRARIEVDHLETLVDSRLWPLPKYREMLFNP